MIPDPPGALKAPAFELPRAHALMGRDPRRLRPGWVWFTWVRGCSKAQVGHQPSPPSGRKRAALSGTRQSHVDC